MNELINIFGQPTGTESFDQIRISIAAPELIRSSSVTVSVVVSMTRDPLVQTTNFPSWAYGSRSRTSRGGLPVSATNRCS